MHHLLVGYKIKTVLSKKIILLHSQMKDSSIKQVHTYLYNYCKIFMLVVHTLRLYYLYTFLLSYLDLDILSISRNK